MIVAGSSDTYTPLGVIGHGATSMVYAAKRLSDGKLMCLKIMEADKSRKVHEEIENMKQLYHPNIIRLHDVIDQGDTIALVMDLADNGTLIKLMSHGPVAECFAYDVFTQTLSALDYLHNRANIVHRDLKPENILLDNQLHVKLIDFGYSKKAPTLTGMTTPCGSPAFMAPEVIKHEAYSASADLWSLGVILYAMVTGKLPFDDDNVSRLLDKIVHEDLVFPEEPEISPPCKELIIRLLEKDPAKRITMREIRQSEWVTHEKERPKAIAQKNAIIFQQKLLFPKINKGSAQPPRFKPILSTATRRFSGGMVVNNPVVSNRQMRMVKTFY